MNKKLMKRSALLLVLISSLTGCGSTGSGSAKETADPGATEKEVLVKEGNGQVVSTLPAPVINYIKAMKSVTITGNDYCFNDEAGAGVAVKDYWKSGENFATQKGVHLSWKKSQAPYTVQIATNPEFTDAETYTSTSSGLCYPNPYMATTYYWKVTNSKGETNSVSSFTTEDYVRFMDTGEVNNVRDLGGRMTSSGKRVKQGIIYRGAEMNIQSFVDGNGSKHYLNLKSREIDILKNQMKIRTEIDFRSATEIGDNNRSYLGPEVRYFHDSISAYTGMFCKHSSNGQDNPTMRATYQEILRTLATANKDDVMYFHCWGGADRTGTIGFLINGLLGVSYTDLLIDFELTTFSNNFRSREDNADYYNYYNSMVTQLKGTYQKSADETISTVIERYMKECLYLTDDDINLLKTNLMEA